MAFKISSLTKFIPLIPQLINLVMKLIGASKKKADPAKIAELASREVTELVDAKSKLSDKEKAEWAIVRGED